MRARSPLMAPPPSLSRMSEGSTAQWLSLRSMSAPNELLLATWTSCQKLPESSTFSLSLIPNPAESLVRERRKARRLGEGYQQPKRRAAPPLSPPGPRQATVPEDWKQQGPPRRPAVPGGSSPGRGGGASLAGLTVMRHGRGSRAELGAVRSLEKHLSQRLHFQHEARVLRAGVLPRVTLLEWEKGPLGGGALARVPTASLPRTGTGTLLQQLQAPPTQDARGAEGGPLRLPPRRTDHEPDQPRPRLTPPPRPLLCSLSSRPHGRLGQPIVPLLLAPPGIYLSRCHQD